MLQTLHEVTMVSYSTSVCTWKPTKRSHNNVLAELRWKNITKKQSNGNLCIIHLWLPVPHKELHECKENSAVRKRFSTETSVEFSHDRKDTASEWMTYRAEKVEYGDTLIEALGERGKKGSLATNIQYFKLKLKINLQQLTVLHHWAWLVLTENRGGKGTYCK